MINSSHTVKTWPDDNDIFEVRTPEKWIRVEGREEAETLAAEHQHNGRWAQVVVVEISYDEDSEGVEQHIGLADWVENS